MKTDEDGKRDVETYAIIGAAMAVHTELGAGFLEPVYQDALKIEFEERRIPALDQVKIQVIYHGKTVESYYIADFVCYDSVIVELKAQTELTVREEAQLLNYLKATRIPTWTPHQLRQSQSPI